MCRQFALGDVPATLSVKNLSAEMTLVSLDGPLRVISVVLAVDPVCPDEQTFSVSEGMRWSIGTASVSVALQFFSAGQNDHGDSATLGGADAARKPLSPPGGPQVTSKPKLHRGFAEAQARSAHAIGGQTGRFP